MATYAAISLAQPQWLSDVHASYISDDHAQDIIAKLLMDDQSVPHYTFSDGLLHYKSRIWVGNVPALQTQLISELHSKALGGHSGVPVTLR